MAHVLTPLTHVDQCGQGEGDQNLKDSGFFNTFQSRTRRAGSSAWNECLTCTQGTVINWAHYEQWLSQNHVRSYTGDLLRYSQKYYHIHDEPQKASELHMMSRSLRNMIMASLANLSKYLGVYSRWKRIVKDNGLKWESRTALETFVDIYESNLQDTKSWLLQVVRELPPEYATVEVFVALTGLRASEATHSCQLIVELSQEDKLEEYLDNELLMLKHFRFQELFLRKCKNAYISFITEELLNLVLETEPVVKYVALQSKLKRLGLGNQTKLLRKLHATTLRSQVPHEVVDLLQGRISQSVFLRFYYKPFLKDIRTKTVEGIKSLEEELLSTINT